MKWRVAQDICAGEAGNLAIIWNEQTQNVVDEFGAPFWIGASDQWTEGEWQTPEKKELPYFKWNRNEPNDFRTGEDCVAILKNGNWNDVRCSNNLPFVCQLKTGTSVFWNISKVDTTESAQQ